MNKITDERLTELVIDLTGNLQRADTSLAVSAAPYFAEVKRRFADVLSALNELQELRKEQADTGCGACNDGCPESGCRVEKESPPVQTASVPDSDDPEYGDGHDWEGFPGGCKRFGCSPGCNPVTGRSDRQQDASASEAAGATLCPVCEEVPMADGNACGRCGGYAPEAPKP